MSKLDDRKPEELRTWFEEDDIARDLIEHLHSARHAQLNGMVSAVRQEQVARGCRHVGAYDELDKLIAVLERKPEKK